MMKQRRFPRDLQKRIDAYRGVLGRLKSLWSDHTSGGLGAQSLRNRENDALGEEAKGICEEAKRLCRKHGIKTRVLRALLQRLISELL